MELFDYCISNPPYQKVVSTHSGPTRNSVDIYPDFQEYGNKTTKTTMMIYPSNWQRSIREGFGSYLFNNGMISADRYSGETIFDKGIEFGYGISVVRMIQNYEGDLIVNGNKRSRSLHVWLNSEKHKKAYEAVRGFKPAFNGLTSLTTLRNIQDAEISFSSTPENITEPVKVYIKKTPGKAPDSGQYYTSREELLTTVNIPLYIDKYKVGVRSSMVGRQPVFFKDFVIKIGHLQTKVFGPSEMFSSTLLLMRVFNTEEEAVNFSKYMNTKFAILLTELDIQKKSFARFVPDLGDYSSNNKNFNWDEPLDPQLSTYFNIL